MNHIIKDFINNNEQLIDNNDWSTVYENAAIDIVNNYEIGEFTTVILDADIDPLEYLDRIPTAYLCSTFTRDFKIPSNIKYIGAYALANTDIKEITIPSNVEHINNYAFSECDYLEVVNIQSGLRTLRSGVFSSCYNLKQINFPPTLKEIGINCFLGCHALPEELYLTEGLETLHKGAFHFGDTRSRTVYLPKSLKYIHPDAFDPETTLIVHRDSYAHTFVTTSIYVYEVIS